MLTHTQRIGEKKTRRESSAMRMEKAARILLEIHTNLMDPELGDVPADFVTFSDFCKATAEALNKKADEFVAARIQEIDTQTQTRYSHGARIHDAIKRGESY